MSSGRHRYSKPRLTLIGLAGGALVAAVTAIALTLGTSQAGPARAGAVALSADSQSHQIATHYTLWSGGGNCSYPGPPADKLFVAMSPSEYNSAGSCGSYLEVTGPHGKVRVEVIDQCPECKAGHIDLSFPAFAKLAPLKAGLINVSYYTIKNPALPGPLAFLVKPGSSRYWLALIVINTGNALASVQVKNSSGHWMNLRHVNWNAWIAQQGAGPGPYTIRVTDKLHHQVTVRGIALKPGKVQQTRTYMYGHTAK
jgi:expansin (peptidoglycan-binding protein)